MQIIKRSHSVGAWESGSLLRISGSGFPNALAAGGLEVLYAIAGILSNPAESIIGLIRLDRKPPVWHAIQEDGDRYLSQPGHVGRVHGLLQRTIEHLWERANFDAMRTR